MSQGTQSHLGVVRRRQTARPGADTSALPRQRGSAAPILEPPVLQVVRPPLDGLGQVTELVLDGVRGLPGTLASPRRTSLWVLWLIGIVGDAWTSHAMITSGRFVEGNPLAAVGMGRIGMTGYLAVTTVICLAMATVSTGRPCGPVARVAVGFLLLVCAGKVFMAVSNLLLWSSTGGW